MRTNKLKKKIIHSPHVTAETLSLRTSPTFREVARVAEGNFGAVFRVVLQDKTVIAVKKVVQDLRFKNREIDILQRIDHQNCIKLIGFFIKKEGIPPYHYLHILTNFVQMDLKTYFSHYKITPDLIRSFSYQLLNGLNYIHSMNICHRDIKPKNLLVDPDLNILQICDFGTAKQIKVNEESVSYISERYYRSPELLFESKSYSLPVDVWAVGCVICEMCLGGSPLFHGRSNKQMIDAVASLIGLPTDKDIYCLNGVQIYFEKMIKPQGSKSRLPRGTDTFLIDFLNGIFVYNPNERLTSGQCLQNPYFNKVNYV